MFPKEIWAGNSTVTYSSPTGAMSVTFQDGNWSADEQPGWEKYIRADLYEAALAREARMREALESLVTDFEKICTVVKPLTNQTSLVMARAALRQDEGEGE